MFASTPDDGEVEGRFNKLRRALENFGMITRKIGASQT